MFPPHQGNRIHPSNHGPDNIPLIPVTIVRISQPLSPYICTMMKWILPEAPNQSDIVELAQALNGVPEALANLLWQRNIRTLEDARSFFYPDKNQIPDPFLMQDMDLAADRLTRAILSGEKVFLLGDYDVDGTTSVSMMHLILEKHNVPLAFHIPDRYKEGYGVSWQGIDAAAESGATLLITLDCGVRSVEQIKYANERGIEVIVCDHHEAGEVLPPALAVLDPKRKDCSYPFKELSGCGVAYKLLQACYLRLGLPMDDLDEVLDLLALSIACDIVSITGENRIYAALGVQKLLKNPLPGIRSIMNLSDRERAWGISDLVFFVGPRINAAGRITHAKHAVEVLTGKATDLSDLAKKLETDNTLRRSLDAEHTRQALQMIEMSSTSVTRRSTVLYHPEWHKGLVGIVASRVIERHYKPTILLARAEGKWVGSARSVQGFDLYQALCECKEYILQFGGHKYAAGLTLNEEYLIPFLEKFEEVVSRNILEEQLHPRLTVDGLLHLSEVTPAFIRMLSKMEPHGPGNLQPVFVSGPVQAKHIRILKDEHIKFVACEGDTQIPAIGFGMADFLPLLESEPVYIAYHANFNVFNGQSSIQLMLKDIKPADAEHTSFQV
jgi:single-stranded-DNA-specific exonuclease